VGGIGELLRFLKVNIFKCKRLKRGFAPIHLGEILREKYLRAKGLIINEVAKGLGIVRGKLSANKSAFIFKFLPMYHFRTNEFSDYYLIFKLVKNNGVLFIVRDTFQTH
jgi:hypothetical protein